MENRIENSHGTAIPKKSRSLDLKSLYKTEVTKTKEAQKLNLKRKGGSIEGSDEKRYKKKKNRKEVSLSSLDNVDGSGKKIVAEDCHGGSGLVWQDSQKLNPGSSRKPNCSSGVNKVSPSLDHGVIQIPKRKRGIVGRKKFADGKELKPAEESSSKCGLADQFPKISSVLDAGVESSKDKQKKDFDSFEENRSNELNSVQNIEEKDEHSNHLAVNDVSSLKKAQRNPRKRKLLPPDKPSDAQEVEPFAVNTRTCDDSREEDEVNLEENAARMLSSRFDPNCTGFSSSSKSSILPSSNGLPLLLSSSQDFVSNGSKWSESALVDTAGRVLRPRKQHNEKGGSRKRRHYYEIFYGDLDAYWVLNRRIRVFWPLDQSWYYGLVSDYDQERKLHHVKYDDRDEEWINLQNERFKLLLLPSEVPGRKNRKKSLVKSRSSGKHKESIKTRRDRRKELSAKDDSYLGSYMDSEPIISWLARTSHHVKSSSHGSKKQKTSCFSLNSASLLMSNKAVKVHGCSTMNDDLRDRNNLCRNSVRQDGLGDAARREKKPTLKRPFGSEDSKPCIVYFRRRFRKFGSESSFASEAHQAVKVNGSVSSLDPFVGGDWDLSQQRMNTDRALALPFRFQLRFPMSMVLNDAFESENLWFVHAVMLLHYGTVMARWPRIHLEMLFVDNVVGIRYLCFEGCLRKAVAFVFQVLMVFDQNADRRVYFDQHLPVTSIKFKFSCIEDFKKHLVFAFYNFARAKNSKWKYLDCKLTRYCRLHKQLPLSECTYDNIQELQNESKGSLLTAVRVDPHSFKVTWKRSRHGLSSMGISRESSHINASPSSSSDVMLRKLPPIALSFAAAPTFFLSLHLRLLMEHSLAHISLHDNVSEDDMENSDCLISDDFSDDSPIRGSTIVFQKDLGTSKRDAATNEWLFSSNQGLLNDGSICNGAVLCQNHEDAGSGEAGTSVASFGSEKIGIFELSDLRTHHLEIEHCSSPPRQSVDGEVGTDGHSFLDCISVEIPSADQIEKHVNSELHGPPHSTDLSCNINGGIIPSPNPTAPRSTWHRNRSSSSSFGFLSHGWSDGKAEPFHNNFSNGPRKPRTQVSYSLPFGSLELNSRQRSHHPRGIPHKRIRKANERRSSDVSGCSKRNLESISCDANVLITLGDKGWRECGAQVVLELFDHSEWKLAVKFSGMTKYSYKAHQFLQPGSTNRYTHAMMWKGGKDWILEFPDRSQWALFKEIHEECYNRNIRAASVKNIPIPGVCLIEENDDSGPEVAFIRSSKYYRQVQTDVEMALDPSRILYDMDSEDEQWMASIQGSENDNGCLGEVLDNIFEKTMNMFEKAAYAQQRDHFTPSEIEELMGDIGPLHVVKTIYEYWQERRHKKGMALIRHFQPPLWEKYQQQVREWEQVTAKNNATVSNGYLEKASTVEKPPMFAFCLKPRGLEVPNKGSKQRSQKKISLSGKTSIICDHDNFHAYGRRFNGFASGDEKFAYPGLNYDSLDDSPLPQTLPRVFSPWDAGSTGHFSTSYDRYDRNHVPKLHGSKSKKFRSFMYPSDSQFAASYNQRTLGKRNGINRWNTDYYYWPIQRQSQLDVAPRHAAEQLDGSDLDEFRLHDASGAARHAHIMAKLKRERAQRLLYRADLAIHKAVVALMTAEAIKASDNSGGDG